MEWSKEKYYGDDLRREAARLANILQCDTESLTGPLIHNSQEEPQIRMRAVVLDYFNKNQNEVVNRQEILRDAREILTIFPNWRLNEVMDLLTEFSKEPNRKKITIQILLNQNGNKTHNLIVNFKRSLSDVKDDNVTTKKPKSNATATVVSVQEELDDIQNDIWNIWKRSPLPVLEDLTLPSTSSAVDQNHAVEQNHVADAQEAQQSADSQATIVYNVNNSQDLTDMQRLKKKSKVVEILKEQRLLYEKQGTNSLTFPPEPLNDSNSDMSLDEDVAVVESEQAYNLVKKVANTGAIKKHETNSESTIPEASSSKVNEAQPSSSRMNTTTIQISFPPYPQLTPDNVTSSSDSEGKYNLHKKLKEMFSDIPPKHIKRVCALHGAKKREKPSLTRWNAIVSSLLMKRTPDSDSTDDDELGERTLNNRLHTAKYEPWFPPRVFGNYHGDFINGPEGARMKRKAVPNPRLPRNHVGKINLASKTWRQLSPQRPITPPPVYTDQDSDENTLDEILRDLGENVSEGEADNEVAEIREEGNNELVYTLMEMFPEACPQYLRTLCFRKSNTPDVLEALISNILETDNYPKRTKAPSPEQQLDPEEQLEIMKQVLPDADPTYLELHCDRLINKPEELKVFIAQAIEHRNYPTMKDYLRKQQLSAQQKQYVSEFSVEKFLEVIPNPAEYFKDPKRKPAKLDLECQHYAMCFLRNHFNKIQIRTIRELFRAHSENFLDTCESLENVPHTLHLKTKRLPTPMPPAVQNIPLLQEMAFYEHSNEIEEYINMKKTQGIQERQEAKQAGLLHTCNCCYDDEVMPKDIYRCENGCTFCIECVRRSAEIAFGDGKLDFPCLNECTSHFSLQTLQAVLLPKMFSKVALKKQLEEVKAAGIEDLEVCPFCEFATIPAKDDKLFRCFNPECMKESCRQCKEPSHVPLRCEEVEKDDDVKRRTYIENKMTEALLRTCYKCGKKFIKADGCNKMTCSCGALMCYVCGQPVKDYKHFNGPGGDQLQLCPLYSDTNQLHEQAVLKSAEEAKQEIGIGNDKKLKIDPSADVKEHYQEMAKKNPPPPYMAAVNANPLHMLPPEFLFMQRAVERFGLMRARANQGRREQRHQGQHREQDLAVADWVDQFRQNHRHHHHHHRHEHGNEPF